MSAASTPSRHLLTQPGGIAVLVAHQARVRTILRSESSGHLSVGNVIDLVIARLEHQSIHDPRFEAALGLQPDLADTHYNLGVALLKMPGRSQEALSHFEAVLRIRPDPQLQQMVNRLRAAK